MHLFILCAENDHWLLFLCNGIYWVDGIWHTNGLWSWRKIYISIFIFYVYPNGSALLLYDTVVCLLCQGLINRFFTLVLLWSQRKTWVRSGLERETSGLQTLKKHSEGHNWSLGSFHTFHSLIMGLCCCSLTVPVVWPGKKIVMIAREVLDFWEAGVVPWGSLLWLDW